MMQQKRDRYSIVREQRFIIAVMACVIVVLTIYVSMAYQDIIRLEERYDDLRAQMENAEMETIFESASEPMLSAVPVMPLGAEIHAEDEPDELPCTEAELEMLAKMLYGEARGCTKTEQAACVWVVLNRVEDSRWADTIAEVVTQPNQFIGYRENNPVQPDLLALAQDVVLRWAAEQSGETYVGRVIPENYYFWYGDGVRNYFRREFEDYNTTWGWTMSSPYEEE